MNLINLLPIVSRWLHILPAITLVGGAIFMRFAYLPALRAVDSGPMDQLREAVRRRWARLVMASVALLLISGLYNAALKIIGFQLDATYGVLLTVKILLALVIFYLASLLAGRSDMARKLQTNELFWLNIVVLLAVILVCIAGLLKMSRHKPKRKGESAAIAARPRVLCQRKKSGLDDSHSNPKRQRGMPRMVVTSLADASGYDVVAALKLTL